MGRVKRLIIQDSFSLSLLPPTASPVIVFHMQRKEHVLPSGFVFLFFFLPFFFFFLYFYIVLTIALQGCPMESHGSLFLCHVWGNFSSSWCSSRLLRESGWCPVKLEEGKCQLKIDFRNPLKFLRKEEVKFTRGRNMKRVLCDSDLLLAATRARNGWGTP